MKNQILFSWGILLSVGCILPFSASANAQSKFQLDFHEPERTTKYIEGKSVTLITIKFTITEKGEDVTDVDSNYKVVVLEEGKKLGEVPLPRPTIQEKLFVFLGVDTSGSMAEQNKMVQAREAAEAFFGELPGPAKAGLILFNEKIRDFKSLKEKREILIKAINETEPEGGTAYLDACMKAIERLEKKENEKGDRAIVLMTDGLDLNSQATLEQVVARAKKAKVRIYPVGLGTPGKGEKVTSIMVLDTSGSMEQPADDKDQVSKLVALQRAAKRFIQTMPATKQVRSTVLEFSDRIKIPSSFTSNQESLIRRIGRLRAKGETSLFDATYTAIAAIEADGTPSKKAVIALSDGIDNSSRRRVEEVIARAKEAEIPLYMLGFGRAGELDEEVMKRMAQESGSKNRSGRYFHAENESKLLQIFESLSAVIHDDGIDEKALKYLAKETGGNYFPAKDIKKLKFILKTVTKKIQRKEYVVSFPSRFQRADGLGRKIEIKLLKSDGQIVGSSDNPDYQVVEEMQKAVQSRGLVLAQMSPVIYLGILSVLGLLLAIPASFHWLTKSSVKR